MYGDLKDWLAEGGAIPDDDDLASDMSGPKQKWRANNDWLLESKTEMKARGLRSSDLSDACALTFATREWFDTWAKPERPKGFGAGAAPNELIGHNGGPPLQDDVWDSSENGSYGWMG
jgi:hypothetical protein